MPAPLLLLLDSTAGCAGFAQAEGAPQRVEDAGDSARLLAKSGLDELVAFDAGWDSKALDKLRGELGHSAQAYSFEDIAYLLALPGPAGSAGMQAAWSAALAGLNEVSGELLAQLCWLAGQADEARRFGFLETELARRYDALSQPAPGSVEIEPLLARKLDEGGPARQEVPPDLLEQLFHARGKLQQAFTQYEERPEQLAMIEAIDAALSAGHQAVVEAGTGVGKSLGYLLPLALHSARTGKLCLVSTNTINLQEQLMSLDLPRTHAILDPLRLRAAQMKGREHYLCVKRLEDACLRNTPEARSLRERLLGSDHDSALLLLMRVLISAEGGKGADLDAIPAAPGLSQAARNTLLRALDCGYKTCLGDRCPYKPGCHYFTQRERALKSNIAVVNHALVFAQAAGEDSDNLVSRAGAIVFDEAHNIESAITSQNTLEVSDSLPIDSANRLLGLLDHERIKVRLSMGQTDSADDAERIARLAAAIPKLPALIGGLAEARSQIARLLDHALAKGVLKSGEREQISSATADDNQRQMLGLLGQLAAKLAAFADRMATAAADLHALFSREDSALYIDDAPLQMELKATAADMLELLIALRRWRPEDPESISWFNCELGSGLPNWTFSSAPLNIGGIYQQLARQKDCIVLSSATLTVAGSFDYLRQSLGYGEDDIKAAQWLSLASPFDYAAQSRLFVVSDMPAPTGNTRDSYLEKLEDMVKRVAEIFTGGVLVLFNSYRDLEHIADRLEPTRHSARLLVQGRSGTRDQLAVRFRQRGDGVLLATRSFWEGFDVAGEALSCVVLAKLPFVNFTDPIHAGRQRALEAQDKDSFRLYSLPLAATLFKQGFGRLIRSREDYGCVFLLDSRVATARYGKVFLDSLPGVPVSVGAAGDCLGEARDFMASRARPLPEDDASVVAQPALQVPD